MISAIFMLAAAALGWVAVLCAPEKESAEVTESTGVVEQAITRKGGTCYVIRFTGEKNKSYLVRTGSYTGNTEKYQEGKLVHIRYWFGKKAPGAQILDEALTAVPSKGKMEPLMLVSGLLMLAGILLLLL